MQENLRALVTAAQEAFAKASDLAECKAARLAHLGDKSPIALANRELGTLAPNERASRGQEINGVKSEITAIATLRESELTRERDEKILIEERVDLTLPTRMSQRGGLHPLTILRDDISDLFIGLGYEVAEGPELESEWLNFDALNIPEDHPARTMQDTFFIEPLSSRLVLRTHTSPVQIRSMLDRTPPIYVICPGRTFRSDELDATHTPVFNQVEGLVIDKGITMAHLKGTLDYFAAAMFGTGITTRLRPSFFPFTEPSAEVDIRCFVCRGESKECRTCKGEGWVEWGGCGMVNPKVLIACGIDTVTYSAFAFGMGLERTLMFRHGITDMREIVEGDIRFTAQFGVGK
ncbi:MAG: phenylalanine--tRNA ligase subunit alpha [Actinobacteria bacterium]|uniref:Phenylalanine--tRNA ligase alpha subunit n=1 Tax=Candidatus Fonsibacter lacus TaxID=2576439 RepID=A0A965LKY3_9PROT|nr:phenylalanine--tRNA ligase subunit alpha [Candidatus Fonsibacter lacus]